MNKSAGRNSYETDSLVPCTGQHHRNEFYQDLGKFWNEMLRYEKPTWRSPNAVVLETRAFKLRRFTGKRRGAAILILGPQAGHHTCIADYAVPGQSLVELCTTATDRPVYAIEWKSATMARTDETIDDLVLQVGQCVDHVGEDCHLIGLCQAGWLSGIYASLYPEKVRSLILGGAPIDFTAGGGKIQDMVQKLRIPADEAKGLMDSAAERAKRYLNTL